MIKVGVGIGTEKMWEANRLVARRRRKDEKSLSPLGGKLTAGIIFLVSFAVGIYLLGSALAHMDHIVEFFFGG